MQKLPPVDDTVILEGLIKYRFVHHIRSTRLKCAKDTLLAGCFVFIPVDMSLPIHLKRKDICLGYPCCLLLVNHIATRIDDYQYLTLSKKDDFAYRNRDKDRERVFRNETVILFKVLSVEL